MLGKPMTGPMRPYSPQPMGMAPAQMQGPMMRPQMPAMGQPGILSLLRPQMGGGRIEPRGPIRNY